MEYLGTYPPTYRCRGSKQAWVMPSHKGHVQISRLELDPHYCARMNIKRGPTPQDLDSFSLHLIIKIQLANSNLHTFYRHLFALQLAPTHTRQALATSLHSFNESNPHSRLGLIQPTNQPTNQAIDQSQTCHLHAASPSSSSSWQSARCCHR